MPSTPINTSYNRFSNSNIKIAVSFTILYLAWISITMGIRVEHIVAISTLLILFFASKTTRNITLGFGFYIIYAILYDSLRIWPNYEFNPVHIVEPYQLEKSLFGIRLNDVIVIPGEYLSSHQSDLKNFLAGAFYLSWVPLPIIFSIYLFFKNKSLLIDFSFTFLLTNIIGFIIYYLYPAAPPWYILMYGDIVDYNIIGNAAGLIEFDKLVGIPIFENMYTRNANVYAAIPSLHAAYPIVLFYFGLKNKVKWMSIIFFIDIVGIWYAAVYSLHHYIIDLLYGALCAFIAIFIFEFLIKRAKRVTFLNTFTNLIRH